MSDADLYEIVVLLSLGLGNVLLRFLYVRRLRRIDPALFAGVDSGPSGEPGRTWSELRLLFSHPEAEMRDRVLGYFGKIWRAYLAVGLLLAFVWLLYLWRA